MFTNRNASTAFDSVECGEVDAKLIVPAGEQPYVRLVMAYVNSETGDRYGKANVYLNMLSKEARQRWEEFCEVAERDWGEIAMKGGSIVKPDDPLAQSAETDQGLRNLGKGE